MALILSSLDPLYVSPRAQTTERRLLQTYLIRVRDCLQGPGRFGGCLGPLEEGTGCRSPTRDGGNLPLFRQFLTLWVASPRAQTAGRRLLQTDLVCAQGGPKGPKRCCRCFKPSAEGTCCRFRSRGGVIGPYLGWFGLLILTPHGEVSWLRLVQAYLKRTQGDLKAPKFLAPATGIIISPPLLFGQVNFPPYMRQLGPRFAKLGAVGILKLCS